MTKAWKTAALAVTLVTLGGSIWLGWSVPAARADLVEGVVAVVDDDVILLSELDKTTNLMLVRIQEQQGAQDLPPEIVTRIRTDALQQLIDQRVMRKYAERVKLDVTQEEIDETVQGIASDEGLDPEQIYAAAAREGLARDDYRRELGNQITQMKVMSGAVRSRIEVSPTEVEELYAQRFRDVKPGVRARVRHIFLPFPGEKASFTRDQVRELGKQIRARAIQSGDFASLAKQYSAAPSAPSGGLTTLRQNDVTPDIAQAVFGAPSGALTPLIETPTGLNLFEVIDQFDPTAITLEQVEPQLRAELLDRKMEPEFERWITEQRKQYHIEIVAPELK
jgi:peptidyl-prolyl cis-trans isomerase SurA